MGRRGLSRSVKRIPPSPEALEKYLRLWSYLEVEKNPERDLPKIDPVTLFGREQPLELEVGCGTGEFMNDLAQARPDTGFVGVDPSTKSLFLAVREADTAKIENVRYLRAPMDALYPHLVEASLSAVYVHFPDPFARNRRQHKVLNPAFLERIHFALRPGGIFSVVSDQKELFEEALTLVEQTPGWEKTHAERFLVGYEPHVKSRYQKKWERFELTALRFEVRRVAAEVAPRAVG
jgi:tRNA (guanine-N7-)-methyltransferase